MPTPFLGTDSVAALRRYNYHCCTPKGNELVTAVQRNDFRAVDKLLYTYGRGFFSDQSCDSALKAAAYNANFRIVEILVHNLRTFSDEALGTAVTAAAAHNNLDMIQKLLARGVFQPTIDQTSRSVAVESAASHNNAEMLKLLLASGPVDWTHRVSGAILSKSLRTTWALIPPIPSAVQVGAVAVAAMAASRLLPRS
jgi:ankyrin repeat protein